MPTVNGSASWWSSRPSSRRGTRRRAHWQKRQSRPAACSCPSPPAPRRGRRDAARYGRGAHRRVRAKGTAPGESAPSPIQPPSTLPSPLASPLPARATRRVLRQRDACAYPFNVLPATLRRRARYFATLLARSYLSIWLSQIVHWAHVCSLSEHGGEERHISRSNCDASPEGGGRISRKPNGTLQPT